MDHFNRFKSVFIYFILNAAGHLPKPANIKKDNYMHPKNND